MAAPRRGKNRLLGFIQWEFASGYLKECYVIHKHQHTISYYAIFCVYPCVKLILDRNIFYTGAGRPWHHSRERDRPGFEGDRDRPPREFDRDRPGQGRERRYSGRTRGDSWHEDSEDMPEWGMDDDPFDVDTIGTFDASGAFCSMKVSRV